jgi:hypothetical protein
LPLDLVRPQSCDEQPADNVAPSGGMRVTVAPGRHTVDATFERMPLRWSADLLSAAALLLALFVATRTLHRTHPKP